MNCFLSRKVQKLSKTQNLLYENGDD